MQNHGNWMDATNRQHQTLMSVWGLEAPAVQHDSNKRNWISMRSKQDRSHRNLREPVLHTIYRNHKAGENQMTNSTEWHDELELELNGQRQLWEHQENNIQSTNGITIVKKEDTRWGGNKGTKRNWHDTTKARRVAKRAPQTWWRGSARETKQEADCKWL